jgi:hypothetical protein
MVNQPLPLCPCGSGKLYEVCCFKKKGVDGEPLFHNGAGFSNDGVNFHPTPNVGMAAIVVGQAIDKYRECAKDIVIKSSLSINNHGEFISDYALFFYSYEQLLKTLLTPHGKGASFEIDTIEARYQWRAYLVDGRILLDFLGLHSRETLDLKQDIGGLNDKSISLLLSVLLKLGQKDTKYLGYKCRLDPLVNDLIDFISLRNKEKIQGNTIIEFPAINSEHGIVKDGKISVNTKTFDMISFINKSFKSVHELTMILLGNK